MSTWSVAIVRWTMLAVGWAMIALNALHLVAGVPRLRARIAAGEVAQSLAAPFLTAWIWLGIVDLILGVILLLIARDAATGNVVARRVALSIGIGLLIVGLAAFAASPKHPGLLVVSLFGLILVGVLLL